jgi:hypothetical protein
MPMDHEERFSRIDRQLEFLAGNHAQLWADLQELQQISRRHSEQLVQVGDFILRLGRVVEEQGRQLERRIENETEQRREETRRRDEESRRRDEESRRRDEESRRFDERLNALFERYFGNGGKDRSNPSH